MAAELEAAQGEMETLREAALMAANTSAASAAAQADASASASTALERVLADEAEAASAAERASAAEERKAAAEAAAAAMSARLSEAEAALEELRAEALREAVMASEQHASGAREVEELSEKLRVAVKERRRAEDAIARLQADVDGATASHALDARDAASRLAAAMQRAERAEAEVASLEAELRASQGEMHAQRSEARRRAREVSDRLEQCEDQQATELSTLRRAVAQLQLELREAQQRAAEAEAARTEAQRLLHQTRESAEAAEARAGAAAAAAAAEAEALAVVKEEALHEVRSLEARHRSDVEQVVRDAHLEQRRLQQHAEAMLFSAHQALRASEETAERERWRNAHAVVELFPPEPVATVAATAVAVTTPPAPTAEQPAPPVQPLARTAYDAAAHFYARDDVGAAELRRALHSLAAERWAKLAALLRARPCNVDVTAAAPAPALGARPRAPLQPHGQWIPVLDIFSDAQLKEDEGVLLRNVISSQVAPFPATVSYTRKPL